MLIKKKNIEEERDKEILANQLAKATATIDYLAMMTDIELPNESEVIINEQEI